MKKILISTGLLFCFTFYAQHNYDNQGVIYSTDTAVTLYNSETLGEYHGTTEKALEIYSSTGVFLNLKAGDNSLFLINHIDFGSSLHLPDHGPFSFNIGGTSTMRIQPNGDVSIGTTESATGYKLSVGGKIMAEELKVQLEADWPDFVFEPNYNLSNLSTLEKFINKNKHLPNIPSAKEVKENGIKVGEMNAKLLQKIEELTLYVIDLHKETEKLKKELLLLKKSNNLN